MTNFIVKGGFFIWPILLCSVVSFAVVLERLKYFHRTHARNKNLPERAQNLINAKKPDEAYNLCEQDGSFIGRFLAVGIKVMDRPADEKGKILRRAGSRELEECEKHLRILSVIGNIATLLGLLGTVTGMIQTFIKIETWRNRGGRITCRWNLGSASYDSGRIKRGNPDISHVSLF